MHSLCDTIQHDATRVRFTLLVTFVAADSLVFVFLPDLALYQISGSLLPFFSLSRNYALNPGTTLETLMEATVLSLSFRTLTLGLYEQCSAFLATANRPFMLS